jgi:hypothetical protein
MSRSGPAAPFADFLRKRRGTIPNPTARHCEHKRNDGTGSTVDGIAAQAANQNAAHAIQHLNWIGGQSRWAFDIQIGLGTILTLSDPRREKWELPDTRLSHELLPTIYSALGRAIKWGTTDIRLGKIEIDHLTEGLLAAARLVEAIDKEKLTERHNDDRSRVKILIHYARIAEHRQDMAERQRDRERGTIEQMLGTAEAADIFG